MYISAMWDDGTAPPKTEKLSERIAPLALYLVPDQRVGEEKVDHARSGRVICPPAPCASIHAPLAMVVRLLCPL